MKAYTDLEQSKKLAEILPIESADMCYIQDLLAGCKYGEYRPYIGNIIPAYGQDKIKCWSLAALLDILPKDESIDCAITFGYYNGKGEYIEKWLCVFEKEGETTDDFIIETIDGSNPVDACYEMVLKLNELNLL